MAKPILDSLARTVEPIARAAGVAIMEIYNRAEGTGIAVADKADGSPLTAADEASERVLQAGLKTLPGNYLIVSEESQQLPYEQRKTAEYAWIVDPLDGTKEFIKRNGEFCVCVALVRNGEPILGVIHAPVTQVSYVAWEGATGVHTVDAAGADWQVLRKRTPKPRTAAGLRFCVSRSHLSAATEAFLADYHQPKAVPMGSALKFCGIANDTIDVYPRHAPTMEWDTAAGQMIAEVAGAHVLDVATHSPMTYNKPDLHNPHFIASIELSD